MPKYASIRLTAQTRDRLRRRGEKGATYEDIVVEMLNKSPIDDLLGIIKPSYSRVKDKQAK